MGSSCINASACPLDFIREYGDVLYPDVPVVFCGVNGFNSDMLKGHDNYWGISESLDYESTLASIKRLFPMRKNLYIINDKSVTGKNVKIALYNALPAFKNDFNITYTDKFVPSKVLRDVKKMNDDDVIYLLIANRNEEGVFISYKDFIDKLYNESPAPIFSSWGYYLNNGIIGGKLLKGERQGEGSRFFFSLPITCDDILARQECENQKHNKYNNF